MKIAGAPVSWGIWEVTIGSSLPSPSQVLKDMADLGYAGTESGPPGYLGSAGNARALLEKHHLSLVGMFIPYEFAQKPFGQEEQQHLRAALRFLDEAMPDTERPLVVLSDSYTIPERMACAGRVEQHPEAWLDDAGWELLHANVRAAAQICRSEDFQATFHYEAGSYVETPREIDRLIAGIDTETIGLCLDTGHSYFGGGDPIDLLRQYGSIVNHVHLKDVNTSVVNLVRHGSLGLDDVWALAPFCELGTGSVDLDGCLQLLEAQGYSGWVVVEQDLLPSPSETSQHLRATARKAAKANREFLRSRGH